MAHDEVSIVNYEEFAEMALSAYNVFHDSNQPITNFLLDRGWEILLDEDQKKFVYVDPYIGLHIGSFIHKDNRLIVFSVKGTDAYSDWLHNNIRLVLRDLPASSIPMNFYMDSVRRLYPDHRFLITGHSLGAALAEHAAWNTPYIEEAVTFESPGSKYLTIDRTAHPRFENLKITTFVTVPNSINCLGEHTALAYGRGSMYRIHIPHNDNRRRLPSWNHGIKCVLGTGSRLFIYGAWIPKTTSFFFKAIPKTVDPRLCISSGVGAFELTRTAAEAAGATTTVASASGAVAATPAVARQYVHGDQHSMQLIRSCFHSGDVHPFRFRRQVESWPNVSRDYLGKLRNFVINEAREMVPFLGSNAGLHTVFNENYIRECEISRMVGYRVEGDLVQWTTEQLVLPI